MTDEQTKPPAEGQALQTQDPAGAALARPNFIPATSVGTEHIKKDDLQMPRLALAQALSPEIAEVDPKYIKGLQQGDFFNNVTKRVYGRGPMKFMIVRADPPRYVEFNPREQGGGVKDINVAPNDPRTRFGEKGEKPVATKFYDFIVVLLPSKEVISLSFKSSGLKIARELNGLVKLRNAPLYAGIYELKSVQTKNTKGVFFIPQVVNSGWPSAVAKEQGGNPDLFKDENEGKAMYEYAEGLFRALKDRAIVIDRTGADTETDPDDFPYGDNAPAGAHAAEM